MNVQYVRKIEFHLPTPIIEDRSVHMYAFLFNGEL